MTFIQATPDSRVSDCGWYLIRERVLSADVRRYDVFERTDATSPQYRLLKSALASWREARQYCVEPWKGWE